MKFNCGWANYRINIITFYAVNLGVEKTEYAYNSMNKCV